MNKEEIIAFINSIDFELSTNFVLTYYKKKPNSYSRGEYEYESKTITFNKDYEKLINENNSWLGRRIDDLYAGLRELREGERNKE